MDLPIYLIIQVTQDDYSHLLCDALFAAFPVVSRDCGLRTAEGPQGSSAFTNGTLLLDFP